MGFVFGIIRTVGMGMLHEDCPGVHPVGLHWLLSDSISQEEANSIDIISTMALQDGLFRIAQLDIV